MKRLLIALVTVIAFSGGTMYLSAYSEEAGQSMMSNSMGSMMDMCQTMMNSIPKDVIMKTISSQVAKVGQESTITLLVLDKKTGNPMDNANVILHIEEGAPMQSMEGKTMMDMMQGMFEAKNIGSGKYQVKFTPNKQGYYTMHTHAIPQGKSMMSMMDNHMDIGIIAK
jgi:5-hydroxyisourate hydrolase-like protein (transthyretin family)